MNRILLVVLFICANAMFNASHADKQQSSCASWEDIARAAMSARQAGVPLETMLNLVSDETAISIFRLAYESPRHSADTARQASISDFTDRVVSHCLSSSKRD